MAGDAALRDFDRHMTAFVGATEQRTRHADSVMDWGVPGQGPRLGNDEGFNTSANAGGRRAKKAFLIKNVGRRIIRR